jgi:hypothetical protein
LVNHAINLKVSFFNYHVCTNSVFDADTNNEHQQRTAGTAAANANEAKANEQWHQQHLQLQSQTQMRAAASNGLHA